MFQYHILICYLSCHFSVLRTTLHHADIRQDSLSWWKQCLRIVQAWALCLLMSLVIGRLIAGLLPESMSMHHMIQDFLQGTTIRYALTVVALMGPILEELMFRSVLVPTRRSLAMGFGVWTVWIAGLVIAWSAGSVSPDQGSWWWLLQKIARILTAVGVWYLLLRWWWARRLMTRLSRHSYLMLGLTSVLFGRVHITNFADSGVWSNILLLTLPQTLIGLVLGAIRIRWKLWHSIVVHCVYNFTLISPIVLLTLAGIPILGVTSDAQFMSFMEKLSTGQNIALSLTVLWILLVFLTIIVVNVSTLWDFFTKNVSSKSTP